MSSLADEYPTVHELIEMALRWAKFYEARPELRPLASASCDDTWNALQAEFNEWVKLPTK